MAYMLAQKTLELNPRHPIFSKMLDLTSGFDSEAEDVSAEETLATDLAMLLLDTAMLQSGFTVEDTAGFAKRMYSMMATGLSLESSELLPEIEIPEEPEDEEEEEVDDLDDMEEEEEDEEEEAEEEEAAAGHEEL